MSVKITNQPNRSRRAKRATPATQSVQILVPKGGSPPSKNRARTRRARKRNPAVSVMTQQQPAKACTITYMKCLLDPWNCTADELPCVPDLYDFPSKKFFTRQRGTFLTGTASTGFVSVPIFNLSNDVTNLKYSGPTWAGTAIPTGVTAGTVEVNNTQSSYASGAMPQYRVVAAGLRVRYQGTELNRSGSIIPCRALGETDTLIGTTVSSSLGRSDVSPLQCDRKWHGVVFQPGYPGAYNWINSNSSAQTQARLAVLVTSAAGAAIQYEYDYVTYFEVLPEAGASIDGMTRSHSDLTGLGYVRDFLGGLTASQVGQSAVNAGMSYLKSYAGPAAPLLEYFGPTAKVGRVKITEL